MSNKVEQLYAQLDGRTLVLDSGMGTMIQSYRLDEADFCSERFADWPCDLEGNNDLLMLSKLEVTAAIHNACSEASVDIIEISTFGSTIIVMADYQVESPSAKVNFATARPARAYVDEWVTHTPEKPRYVADILGPTNRTASTSPNVNDPALRNITFDQLAAVYQESARALVEGNAGLILIETVSDTLNAKATVSAVKTEFGTLGIELPTITSGTIAGASRYTLSGQITGAFCNFLCRAEALAFGLNCALGPDELRQYVQELSRIAECYVTVYPNTGLPSAFGEYNLDVGAVTKQIREWAEAGFLNTVGGCCDITPQHIATMSRAVEGLAPHKLPEAPVVYCLFSLEPLDISEDSLFMNVGECTNIADSARFKCLTREEKYNKVLNVACQQVENGAQAIDVNMDKGMLDAEAVMVCFPNLIVSGPDIVCVPTTIDSSEWGVIEKGLKHIQGKGIVNSISMKEGIGAFVHYTKLLRRYGATVMVMTFDEQGRADTHARKIGICRRAYKTPTEEAGFPTGDIVFDLNTFAIVAGIGEHNNCA